MAPYESPPSPTSASTSSLCIGSPSRIRGSASRPRRSLLSLHFLSDDETSFTKASDGWQQQQPYHFVSTDEVGDGKTRQPQNQAHDGTAMADLQQPSPFRDGFSRSLPSPPISAFLEQREEEEEEEAPEPASPREVIPFHACLSSPPLAPKKTFRHCVVPQGKHKPRRLNFEEGEPSGTAGTPSSLPSTTTTPPRQPFTREVPARTSNPTKRRIQMRDLR